MNIVKADIIPKVDARVSTLPLENKVVAADINELKRVSDDLVDAVVPLLPGALEYGGLFICNGTSSQSIASSAQITVNQWTIAQPDNGFGVENGDQTITIPQAGVYKVEVHYSYETTSKDDEVFAFWVYSDANPIPGLCTRVQHHEPDQNIYSASFGKLVAFTGGEVLSARVDAGALDEARTFDIKHGAWTLYRLGD